MKLKIDNRLVEIEGDVSIHQAAAKAGVDIPTLCYKEGMPHFTSCMICMVKDKTSGKTLPACSARAADGMDIDTQSDDIRAFRKSTLELLLSDHVGDCEAPCQRLCTVHLEIPKMIREIMANDLEAAIGTIRQEMAIPAILERYCNAPCEKGCRRSKYDEGLSIRELTRYVADWDLRRERPCIPPRKPATGKSVAVIGAGPTGLAAAYHLALAGHACAVFEKTDRVGGRIHREFKPELIEQWVFDGERRVLEAMGVQFTFNATASARLENGAPHILWDDRRQEFSAVIFAVGANDPEMLPKLGLPMTGKTVKLRPGASMTEFEGIFAGGSVLKAGQPLAKSIAAGKSMACQATQYLSGQPIVGEPDFYNHNMGRLLEGELEIFLSGTNPLPRLKPDGLDANGFAPAEARLECTRCMHCDCRKNHDCKLRLYSDQYGAEQNAFKGEERAQHEHINQNAGAVYEPGKCIKCGLCVRITAAESEPFGFTFIGRGFDVKPGVALHKTLAEGLEKVAEKVVEACPTGALSHNEKLGREEMGKIL